jgi:hypothetical protein
MNIIDELETWDDFRNYILAKTKEEQIIISFFEDYYDNILFGDKNDEELYKKYKLADKTGQLHAVAVKLRNNFLPPGCDIMKFRHMSK